MDRLQPAIEVDRVVANPVRKRGVASLVLSALLLLTTTFLVAQPSQAEIIAYDPFNQNVGNISGTASSGGDPKAIWPSDPSVINWEGVSPTGSVRIESGSLHYGSLLTQGNHVLVSHPDVASRAHRSLGATYGSGTNLWLSFLMQGTMENENQGLTLSFFNDATSAPKLFIGQIKSTKTGKPYYGIQDARTGTPSQEAFSSDNEAVRLAVHLFVVHLYTPSDTSKQSTVTLYFDPDASSLGSEAPTGAKVATLTLDRISNHRDLSFNQIRIVNDGRGPVRFDEFRMNATIPEPSSLVLSFLLLGLGAVFGWRRRRRAA